MSAPSVIRVQAVVAGEERPAVELAAQRLAAALTTSSGSPVRADCTFGGSAEGPADLSLISLTPELDRLETPWPAVEADLLERVAALCAGPTPVFVCTVFRHIASGPAETRRARLVRLRRLNLLAMELSREFGAYVIDLDRDLAEVGGLALAADYRLESAHAVETAARTIALTVVAYGLDACVDFETQDTAKAHLAAWRPTRAVSGPDRHVMTLPGVIAWGQGRRRQTIAGQVDATPDAHVASLLRNLLRGRIGLGFAAAKLARAIATRGFRESVAQLGQGVARMLRSQEGARP